MRGSLVTPHVSAVYQCGLPFLLCLVHHTTIMSSSQPVSMPWIRLGEVDPSASLTPPPAQFPENTSAAERASMRFAVSGNAACMHLSSWAR